MGRKSHPIIDAFEVVASCDHYHGRWLAAHDLASILCHEFDIPQASKLDASYLNAAFVRNTVYKVATGTVPAVNSDGVALFCYHYSPPTIDGTRPRITCYYISRDKEATPLLLNGVSKWYDAVKKELISSEKRYCSFVLVQDTQQGLLDFLAESKPSNATPPTAGTDMAGTVTAGSKHGPLTEDCSQLSANTRFIGQLHSRNISASP